MDAEAILNVPKIELELIRNGSGQQNLGISTKNSKTEPTFIGDAIWQFNLYWNFEIIIRNKSSYTAYDIKLLFEEGKFDYIDNTYLELLLPNTEKKINANLYRKFDGSDSSKELNAFLPKDISNIKINISYKNEFNNHVFRTIYTYEKTKIPFQKNEILPLPKKAWYKNTMAIIACIISISVTVAALVSGIADGVTIFDRTKRQVELLPSASPKPSGCEKTNTHKNR